MKPPGGLGATEKCLLRCAILTLLARSNKQKSVSHIASKTILIFLVQFQGKCDQKLYQTPALDSTAATHQLPLNGVKHYHHLKNVSLLVFML